MVCAFATTLTNGRAQNQEWSHIVTSVANPNVHRVGSPGPHAKYESVPVRSFTVQHLPFDTRVTRDLCAISNFSLAFEISMLLDVNSFKWPIMESSDDDLTCEAQDLSCTKKEKMTQTVLSQAQISDEVQTNYCPTI